MNLSAPNRSRVLVIDDEVAIRRLVTLVLSEEGHEPLAAGSGLEGLELAAASAPDVVLLDLMMPDLDGQETLARLRALPGMAEVPVVMMSAAVALAEKVPGVHSVLAKPFDLGSLVDAVEQAVAQNAG